MAAAEISKTIDVFGLDVEVNTQFGMSDVLGCALFVGVGLIAWLLARRIAGRDDGGAQQQRSARFHRGIALAGFFLGFDELSGLHETIGFNLPDLPVVEHPDDAIVGLYGLVVAVQLWRWRDVWLTGRIVRGLSALTVVIGILSVLSDSAGVPYQLEEGVELCTVLLGGLVYVLVGLGHAARFAPADVARLPRLLHPLSAALAADVRPTLPDR